MENTKYKEIIEYVAKNKLIETIISNCKIVDEDLTDLAQDLYLYLLEKQPHKLVEAYNNGEINNYLSRIIVNNIYSSTSPYYYKYKRYKLNQMEIEIDKEFADE